MPTVLDFCESPVQITYKRYIATRALSRFFIQGMIFSGGGEKVQKDFRDVSQYLFISIFVTFL